MGQMVYQVKFRQSVRDEDGVALLTITNSNGSQDYIANGNLDVIQDQQNQNVQYSIDCQPNRITLHSASRGYDLISTITLATPGALSIDVHGMTLGNQPESYHRNCRRYH